MVAPKIGSRGSSKVRMLAEPEDRRGGGELGKTKKPRPLRFLGGKTIFLSTSPLSILRAHSRTTNDTKHQQTIAKQESPRWRRRTTAATLPRPLPPPLPPRAPRPGHHPSRRPPAPRRRGLRLQLLVDVLLLVRRRGPGLGQEAGEGAAGRVDGRRRRRRQRRRFQGSGRVGPSGRRGVGAAAAGAAGGRGAPELTVERDHWEG